MTKLSGVRMKDRTLCWCNTHEEPGWLYSDGSKACWWESIVETSTDEHDLVPLVVRPRKSRVRSTQNPGDDA